MKLTLILIFCTILQDCTDRSHYGNDLNSYMLQNKLIAYFESYCSEIIYGTEAYPIVVIENKGYYKAQIFFSNSKSLETLQDYPADFFIQINGKIVPVYSGLNLTLSKINTDNITDEIEQISKEWDVKENYKGLYSPQSWQVTIIGDSLLLEKNVFDPLDVTEEIR